MNKTTKAVLSVVLFLSLLVGLKFIYDSQTKKDNLGNLGNTITTTSGSTSANSTTAGTTTAGVTGAGGTTSTPRTVPLPDITVYDGLGNPVKLSSFKGKKIVINAWASWCGPCKAEMPDFAVLDKESNGDYQVVMVNMTGGLETRENSDRFLKNNNLEFTTMLYDTDLELTSKLQITSIPTSVFVDKTGNIHYYQQGGLTKAQVLAALSEID